MLLSRTSPGRHLKMVAIMTPGFYDNRNAASPVVTRNGSAQPYLSFSQSQNSSPLFSPKKAYPLDKLSPLRKQSFPFLFDLWTKQIPRSMTTFYSPDHGGVYGNGVTKMSIVVTVTNEQFHPIISYAYMTSSREFKVWDTLHRNILKKKSQRLVKKNCFGDARARTRGLIYAKHVLYLWATSQHLLTGWSKYIWIQRDRANIQTVCKGLHQVPWYIGFQVKFSVLIGCLGHLLDEKTIYFQSKENNNNKNNNNKPYALWSEVS